MAIIPAIIVMNWKTSVQITARIPPYDYKKTFRYQKQVIINGTTVYSS